MDDPPVLAGAVNETSTEKEVALEVVTAVGAPGTV
jgi:hypothetical protein